MSYYLSSSKMLEDFKYVLTPSTNAASLLSVGKVNSYILEYGVYCKRFRASIPISGISP